MDVLSQGQKQLFSLARAVLRRRVRSQHSHSHKFESESENEGREKEGSEGGILLLDEVSSSVDLATDRAMQKVIWEEFGGYTIVMVAHRLEMVKTFDRVVVMDAGKVVEVGSPGELGEKEGGVFRGLLGGNV